MWRKIKLFTLMFSLMIVIYAPATLAEETSEALAQGDSASQASDQEQGVPISLPHFYLQALTYKFKTGDTRILPSLKELQDFYVELKGPRGVDTANRTAEFIDFSREVFVVVTSQPMTICKDAGVSALERIQGDQIKITVEENVREPCEPGPLPERKRYLVIGMPIDRPVAKVEVIYTSKTIQLPNLEGK